MTEWTAEVRCADGVTRYCIGQWVPYVAADRKRIAEVPEEARELVKREVVSMGARRVNAGRITSKRVNGDR